MHDDHRHIPRDSLFLIAALRLPGEPGEHKVKVRNLSAGGMMAEGQVRPVRGALVEVEIRNIGWVAGAVAWVQDDRFGIAFSRDVDPKRARLPVTGGESTPRYAKPVLPSPQAPRHLRKI
ncbi:MAG: PilZ domain-containing protein [Novosphingobium sp.]